MSAAPPWWTPFPFALAGLPVASAAAAGLTGGAHAVALAVPLAATALLGGFLVRARSRVELGIGAAASALSGAGALALSAAVSPPGAAPDPSPARACMFGALLLLPTLPLVAASRRLGRARPRSFMHASDGRAMWAAAVACAALGCGILAAAVGRAGLAGFGLAATGALAALAAWEAADLARLEAAIQRCRAAGGGNTTLGGLDRQAAEVIDYGVGRDERGELSLASTRHRGPARVCRIYRGNAALAKSTLRAHLLVECVALAAAAALLL